MRISASVLIAVVVLVTGGPQPGMAQPAIPHLWESGQRLPRPDVSSIRRLRFLTTTDFFPFNFLDREGELVGFNVDLARAVCEVLEIAERCQIQALPFEELETALAEGEGEALIAGVAITRETRARYLFTRPYLQFPARFVARRGPAFAEPLHETLRGRSVGVMAGTAHEAMLREQFAGLRAVTYTRQASLLQDLKEGRIDAVFGDGVRLSFWLAGEAAEDCCAFVGGSYLAPEYLGHGLAIAVRPDEPVLAAALDHALQEIEARGTFAELYLRYFPVGFY